VHDENLQGGGDLQFLVGVISSNIDITPMNSTDTARLLAQIAQIQRMERGKLTVMRQGPEGPYYKLQAWENGSNISRYVARDEAAAVQEAIDGFQQFEALIAQYAQAVINQTRAQLAARSKKKHYHLRRRSAWPKTRRSDN